MDGHAGLPTTRHRKWKRRPALPAARIERIAKEFAEQKPALAIIAGPALAQTNGLFNALAVNALNALVGSVETPGGIFFTPRAANSGTGHQFREATTKSAV